MTASLRKDQVTIENVISYSTLPGTGETGILVKTDGLYLVNSAGVETKVFNLASVAEINAGTEAGKAITPDALAGSNMGTKSFAVEVFAFDKALTTGDGKRVIPIPASLAGMNVISIHGQVFNESTSGAVAVQVARGRKASPTTDYVFNDMLPTNKVVIDQGEFDSKDATVQPGISATYDDLAEGDLLRIDVDGGGTGVTGLWIRFGARLP